MALIRTDYGLIYNTDGSLCATLLPEGGVAVTEGTTNLCDPAYMYTNTWTTIDYSWNRQTIIDCTAGDIISISADIRNLSQGEDRRWGKVSFRDSGGIELEFYNAMGRGMSERRLSFTTPAAPAGTVEAWVYWINNAQGSNPYQGKNFQIEKKPYDTPFVDGIRPPGRLAYPSLVLDPREGAIRFKFIPLVVQSWNNYFLMPSLSNGRFLFFLSQSGVGRFDYGAANSGPATPEGVFQARQEYDVVLRWSINTGKQAIFVNGIKYEQDLPNGVADDFPAQISTVGNYATAIKELCFFKRYPSDDEIRTWHSLDAPFFDPNDRIDAAARPIYAPGVVIDQTGAWGIANGVKQAGFGTDGKWMAGGGAVVADAGGLRSNNGSFSIGTNGQAYFGGTLKAAIVDTPQIVGGAISQKIVSSHHTSTFTEISGYYPEHRNHVTIPYLSVNFTLDYDSQALINVSMETYSIVTPEDRSAMYGINILVDGIPILHAYRQIQPPNATSTYSGSFQIPVNISTALSLWAGNHNIEVTAIAWLSAKSPGTFLGIASREINVLLFKR